MAKCDRCDGTFERLRSRHDKIFYNKIGEVDIVEISAEISKCTLDWINEYKKSSWMSNERRYDGAYYHIGCKDGFSMSVQAGTHIHSDPGTCVGPWYAVEVGFPSQKEDRLIEYIDSYCDDPDPRESVYAYVPTDLVLDIIKKHGGIKTGVLPCMALSNGDEMHGGVVITASLDPKLLT